MPYRDRVDPAQLAAPVPCPNCQIHMQVKKAAPLLFAGDVFEVQYACPRCDGAAKRYLRPSAKPR